MASNPNTSAPNTISQSASSAEIPSSSASALGGPKNPDQKEDQSPNAPPTFLYDPATLRINLTISEILALPQAQRDKLAKEHNVICWDPFTVQATGTPADAYSLKPEDVPNLADLPNIGEPGDDEGEDVGKEEKK